MKPVYPSNYTHARLSDSDVSANGKGVPCAAIDINYQDKIIEVHVPVGAPLDWLDTDQLVVDFKAHEFTLMAQEFTNVRFHMFEGTLPWRVYAKALGSSEVVFAVYRAKYSHVKPFSDEDTRKITDRMVTTVFREKPSASVRRNVEVLPPMANADTFLSRKMIISRAQHEAAARLRDDDGVKSVRVEVGDGLIVFTGSRDAEGVLTLSDFTE